MTLRLSLMITRETVHRPPFFLRIVWIEQPPLRVAILASAYRLKPFERKVAGRRLFLTILQIIRDREQSYQHVMNSFFTYVSFYISRQLILAVCRTPITCNPSKWPCFTRGLSAASKLDRAPTKCLRCHMFESYRRPKTLSFSHCREKIFIYYCISFYHIAVQSIQKIIDYKT